MIVNMKKRADKKKMDKKLIGIIIIIIIAGALIAMFAKYQHGKDYTDDELGDGEDLIVSQKNAECIVDSDCVWHYTDFTKDNPCLGCSVAVPEYVCMNKNIAEKLFLDKVDELFGGLDNLPLCASCEPVDSEPYECKCKNRACTKEKS